MDDRKQLYKLIVAFYDILNARDAAAEVVNRHMHDRLWRPLADACVVYYARPFLRNDPYGPLDDSWSIWPDPEEQRLHDHLIRMRHKTIAHSDAALRRVVIHPASTAQGTALRAEEWSIDTSVTTEKMRPKGFTRVEKLCHSLEVKLKAAIDSGVENQFRAGEHPDSDFDLLTLKPTDIASAEYPPPDVPIP